MPPLSDLFRFPILYVDDEEANLSAMECVLNESFSIDLCGSGAEALERLTQRDYAVLLTDQRMPGMTGVEVCQRAQELVPDTVRVIVTAYADANAIEEAVNIGHVSRFVRKPYRAEEITRVMREAIEIHRGRLARREVEAYLLRTAPSLAVRGIQAELGQKIMQMTEPLNRHIAELRRQANGLDAGAQIALSARLEQSKGAAEALYSYGVRLCMGTPEVQSGRGRLGSVMDATVRALRDAIERIAALDVHIQDDPLVPLETATLSHVVVHLLASVVASIEEDGGDGSIRMTLDESDDRARISVRYTTTVQSLESPPREPPSFITVRHLVEEVGGDVRFDGSDGGASIVVRLPTIQ
jgi:CheY-like chemotaxis protein